MRLKRILNAQTIDLSNIEPLGRGGEARIFVLPPDGNFVAKIYHRPAEAHGQKLRAMLANPPADPMAGKGHVSIAWPQDLLQTTDSRSVVMGYVMPRIRNVRPMIDYYNPASRRKLNPLFNYQSLIRTARNLATSVRTIHQKGYVIGDVNESNVLVGQDALVSLVDTDSFQVRDPVSGFVFRCPVGKPEYTPPELQNKLFSQFDRVPEHDLFGLGVLIFNLLMEGTHPFDGVYEGPGNPPLREERIANGHFVYGMRRGPFRVKPSAPPFETLNPALQQLFVRCFEQGYNNPAARPTAAEWKQALEQSEQSLTTCGVNGQHRYDVHLTTCPWCERTTKLGGRDPFPSLAAVRDGSYATVPVQKTATAPQAPDRSRTRPFATPPFPIPSYPGKPIPARPLVVPRPDRGLFTFLYMIVSAFAAFAGFVAINLAEDANSAMVRSQNQADSPLSPMWMGIFYGLGVALVQMVPLQKYVAKKFRWLVASAIASGFAFQLAYNMRLDIQPEHRYGLIMVSALGLALGQAIALGSSVKGSGWWAFSNWAALFIGTWIVNNVANGDLGDPTALFMVLGGGLQGLFAANTLARLEKK